MPANDQLSLVRVNENNLKNLTLDIPHDKLVVITGVSGSGKSTLAFDTIYAEGGRRYIETFSPYTRQFLDRLHRPDIEAIHGVRPALALEQRNRITNSRSTVGTVTEINDYLKIVWSHLSTITCPECNKPVERDTPVRVVEKLATRFSGSAVDNLLIGFTLKLSGEASAEALRNTLSAEGFVRYFSKAKDAPARLEELTAEELGTELIVVVDRFSVPALKTEQLTGFLKDRLLQSIHQSFAFGHGELVVICGVKGGTETIRFVNDLLCESCNRRFVAPRPSAFSFNSPLGACTECHGFGKVLQIDPKLCIPNPTLSIEEKAVACWSYPKTQKLNRELLKFCEKSGIDTTKPWQKLSQADRDKIFLGTKGYPGVTGWFKKLQKKQYKMHVRVFLSFFRSQFTCGSCGGSRLKSEALVYRIKGQNLPDIWSLPIDKAILFFAELISRHGEEEGTGIALTEVDNRLKYLSQIGLGYLTLDRQMRTLSGGETQRVNLTSILGARLTKTVLVLDEPTIGLHPRDTARLLDTLKSLRSRGNSVLVVEHDSEVMWEADEILDLGPKSGGEGGEIVYQGPVAGILNAPKSLTGQYLNGVLEIKRPESKKKVEREGKKRQAITLVGATANNLKCITVSFPLNQLTVLSGVSGSGKSSLIDLFSESYRQLKQGVPKKELANLQDIRGLEFVDDVVLIDQSPVGRTPRSNPATYTKAWEIIRECLAETPDAVQLGLSKSAFSFNVDGGRCPSCKGAGYERVEMQFLADVYVECEVCQGARFKDLVLSVRFAGKNVLDLLQMSLKEVQELFLEVGEGNKRDEVLRRLKPLLDLGLGYLRLGQPLSEVSGGEAQRIKLASYLSESQKEKCLFILDEPTTGLHPHNISDLLRTFSELLARGHSILCVEHNQDVIKQADYLIDLGPEGGEAGGQVVVEGAPHSLLKDRAANIASHTIRLLKSERRELSPPPRNFVSSAVNQPIVKETPQPIEIIGARYHNLKNISVNIPQNELTVVTGVSGSGKSTLAFDIVFNEGQRRYIDCLSPYARQYMNQLGRAEVDVINSLPPTIAISQKTAPPLGVSTIATTTEIYQYLRLLYAKVGVQHCPEHDLEITGLSAEKLAQAIIKLAKGKRVFLFAPVVSGRKGYYNDLFIRALGAEITEAKIDGEIVRLTEDLRLERHKLHYISLLVASIGNPDQSSELLEAAITQCLLLGNGVLEVALGAKHSEPSVFSTDRVCPECKRGFRELDPQDFSFRSHRGMCKRCAGRGSIGEPGEKRQQPCPDCEGSRIGPIGRHVYLHKRRIHELSALTAPELLKFFETNPFPERVKPVVDPIVTELKAKLKIIAEVGLDYIRLDRESSSISGGEAQRLRLARTLGSPLSGVCYVLDEPTIGLHSEDHGRLMEILYRLRNEGNTIIVVEHDEDTILAAEHIIDVGPGGGTNGGRIVYQGPVTGILECKQSLTGQALKLRAAKSSVKDNKSERELTKLPAKSTWLEIRGARANNLKGLNVSLPLKALTVVMGVSGAGKSSLVHGTLVPAILADFEHPDAPKRKEDWTWTELKNHETLKRFIEIDQSPVGKTSTSCPASYLGIFDDIRKIFAMLPESEIRGWNASHFSFNTGKGRCENCGGRGFITVPMSFLPNATAECELCRGLRYNEETLQVKFQGFSLGELLLKTMAEAKEIFANHNKVRRPLSYIDELGLGYLTLGQPTHTLSGGEAQRLKIARELGSREAVDTLYILDEPTIGLHMTDVDKLLRVLRQLVEQGNTVIVIEHSLDVIRAADYLLELGPGPGEKGGNLIFSGTPAELERSPAETPTIRAIRTSSPAFSSGKNSAPIVKERLKSERQVLPTAVATAVRKRRGNSPDEEQI